MFTTTWQESINLFTPLIAIGALKSADFDLFKSEAFATAGQARSALQHSVLWESQEVADPDMDARVESLAPLLRSLLALMNYYLECHGHWQHSYKVR